MVTNRQLSASDNKSEEFNTKKIMTNNFTYKWELINQWKEPKSNKLFEKKKL